MNVMASRWCRLYPGTPAERAIETHIATLGIPYRTQFPYFLWGVTYFPDFLLPTVGIILEVDDPSHDTVEKQKADALRTSALEKMGWTIVRCTNEEALWRPNAVMQRLRAAMADRHSPGPGLPPAPYRASRPRRRRVPVRATSGRLAVRRGVVST